MFCSSTASVPGKRAGTRPRPLTLSVACCAHPEHASVWGRGSSGGRRGAGAGPRQGKGGGRGAPPQHSDDEDVHGSSAQHIHFEQQQQQQRPSAPQRQQRSASLQRQQERPVQQRAAPVQRGRPQQMLAGARHDGSNDGNRGSSAPRGRAQQRPQRVQRNAKKVISLREWLRDAAENTRQGGASPNVLVSVATSLRRVAAEEFKEPTTDAVTAQHCNVNVTSALQQLHALVKCALRTKRLDMSVFVWAVSEGLEAHPALHAAGASRSDVATSIEKALTAAAQADATYDDGKRVSQVAVAQRQLGIVCMPYWHEVARRRDINLGAREVANVYHAYGKLCKLAQEQDQRSPASQALDSKLQGLVVSCVGKMAPQQVAICLWAAAALGHLAPGALRVSLLWATQHSAASMDAQGVANCLWALAAAEVPITGDLCDELLTAARLVAPRTRSQEVSNILWALATAGVAGDQALHLALHAAAARVASNMNKQDVANMLWALARLQADYGQLCPGDLAYALFDRAAGMRSDFEHRHLLQVHTYSCEACMSHRREDLCMGWTGR